MAKKKITIEDLAVMVQKGFDEAQKDRQEIRRELVDVRQEMKDETCSLRLEMRDSFKLIDDRFKLVDDRFLGVNARLDTIEYDIRGLDFVSRDEFEDLLSRVRLIERKLDLLTIHT